MLYIIKGIHNSRSHLSTGIESTIGEASANHHQLATSVREFNRIHNHIHFMVEEAKLSTEQLNYWKHRERERLRLNIYTPCIWADEPWFRYSPHQDLFAHVSEQNPEKITFTENPEKGFMDIQASPMSPGRFLNRFFGDQLTGRKIGDWAARHAAQHGLSTELQYARTPDEIQHVYENGPSSCMGHPVSKFASDIHPTRIYGAGDLAVAYITRGKRITARCVVWPDKKQFTRVYGDEERINPLLNAAGYHNGQLQGARLLKIPQGNGFVMPYLDIGDRNVKDTGDEKYLFIDWNGDIEASSEHGLSCVGWVCPCCEEYANQDCASYIANESTYWCESCTDNNAFWCEYFERHYSGECYIMMANGSTWSDDAFESYGFTCEYSDESYPQDYAVVMADGSIWCESAFAGHGFVCENNGGNYSNDDAVIMADGSTWSQDAFDDDGAICSVSNENYPACELVENSDGDLVHPEQLELEVA